MRIVAFALVALLLVPLSPLAPAMTPPSAEPRIAILASGIDATHSEFKSNQIVAWKDFVHGRTDKYDTEHGTAVASRAAGKTVGAFPGAPLVVARVSDNQRTTDWGRLAEAIRWSVAQDAAVIAVAVWDSQPDSHGARLVAQAVEEAAAAGILVVTAAGSPEYTALARLDERRSVYAPLSVSSVYTPNGAPPQALVVGAALESGNRWLGTQADPMLLSPGASVKAASPGGGFVTTTGTTLAAGWMAGAAARLVAEGAPRDVDWLKWVLLHAARDNPSIPFGEEGYGFLDATRLSTARAIARGESPVPDPDARDALHLTTLAQRAAWTGHAPRGHVAP